MSDYDSPWKEIIEYFFQDFLAFFYPSAHAGIDWDKGYEFLDKELEQVVRDGELGRRLVDKLVRVWRLDGEEEFVLIHVEIQGQHDKAFAKRMYSYNYRVFDRYDRKVASLAILADSRSTWRPDHYSYDLWGSRSSLWFPMVKLLDYREHWEALTEDSNPFAIAVMAHLQSMSTSKDLINRRHWKIRLTKMLYNKGYSRETVLELFRFIDWVIELPEDEVDTFWQEVEAYEQEKKMPYVTSVERLGVKKGFLEGEIKGEIKGSSNIFILLIEKRFGKISPEILAKIEQADPPQIQAWSLQFLDATTLEEVFKD